MIAARRAVMVLLACALAAQAGLAATPPELLSYQGVLRGADGAPLDGSYDMVFRFTAVPAGGTLLLTDYHTGPNAVTVDGGLFTVLLGGGTLSPGIESSLQDIFARYSPVWVEVQVGAETLAPRVQIVSTAYALNAGRLGGQLPGGYVDTGTVAQVKLGSLTAQPAATSGDVRALQGITASTSGVGVLGSAVATSGATEGVRGQSTSPGGTGVVGGAFATSGAGVGVFGETQSPDGTGVYGRASATGGGTVGVAGEIFSTLGTGVAGVAHATSGEAWGVYGETASAEGYGVVSVGDSITAGDVYATGTKYFLAEHPRKSDRAIRYACLEGGEVGVYHRGSGRLSGGAARIALPDPFPLVATGRITVQVTPEEDCGGLYVPPDEVSAEGFTVRESGGARSNAAFSYLVLAERSGYQGAETVRPLSVSDKIMVSRRLSPGQKATLRAALATQSVEAADPAERAALYATLDEGDFDASCELLGGCEVASRTPRAGGRRDVPPAASGVPSAPSRRSVVPVATPEDSPPVGAASPPAPETPPPSVLVAPHVMSRAVEAGDVVVLDRGNPGALRPGDEAGDPAVVGVVAFVEDRIVAGEQAPVAVAGIVRCRVDAGYGAIAPGDLLVASPTSGHAMRAEAPSPGTILGKALDALDEGQGTIWILLAPR